MHFTGSVHKERTGNSGNIVHEILTDFQDERPAGNPNNPKLGNGWMKWLTIFPDQNLVKVFTEAVEPNNTALFPNGPEFFETHVYNSNPDDIDHNFSFRHNFTSPLAYRYDDNQSRIFGEREINATAAGDQKEPTVARNMQGISVVAWTDDRDGNGVGNIYARLFTPDGCQLLPEFMVHASANGDQIQPSVAIN
jgi:hypothetical protein